MKMSVKTHQNLPLFQLIDLCFYITKTEGIVTDDIKTSKPYAKHFVHVKKLDL
jgi:hypothetical protein